MGNIKQGFAPVFTVPKLYDRIKALSHHKPLQVCLYNLSTTKNIMKNLISYTFII